mmetsp:Transcript_40439/g.91852  ORF Transcript_40439/g.91852 Transcript_40439/m.91852 type:complete len:430 (-) Transcript_40439:58-1347(-)
MSVDGELKPLLGNRPDWVHVAVLVAAAGSVYALGTVPLTLAVIAQSKVDLTGDGLTRESVSKAQALVWIGWSCGAAFILPSIDRFGRKLPYFGLLALGLAFSIVNTQAQTVFLYGLSIFFVGLAIPPSGTIGFLLLQESLPESYWPMVTCIENVFYSSTTLLVALIGGTVAKDVSWRVESLFWCIPYLLVLLAGPLVLRESPAFTKAQAERESDTASSSSKEQQQGPMAQLFCQPTNLGRMIATMICWAACTVGFYGISFCSGKLSADLYQNLGLLAIVDIISYGLSGACVQALGARPAQMLAFFLAAVCMVVSSSLPAGPGRVVMALCSRFAMNVAFTTIYLLLMECFPVECRGSAAGAANFVARMIGLITPLFATMHLATVGWIMCVLSLSAVAATWTLPSSTATRPAVEFPCCSGGMDQEDQTPKH